MIRSTHPGRILFAVAIAAFAAQYLLSVTAMLPAPGPPWPSTGPSAGVVLGAILLALALCMAFARWAPQAAVVLASGLFLTACINSLPQLVAAPRKPGPWTGTFELLAMCGGALVLASALSKKPPALQLPGRLLFAVSLAVFGVQHFLYAAFIATLVPSWVPGHLFWAYFVGVAFFASALSLATGVLARLASTLLGLMFLLWVVLLHLPRCFAAPHNGNEWTSAFVALAMGGCAWILAGACQAPFSWRSVPAGFQDTPPASGRESAGARWGGRWSASARRPASTSARICSANLRAGKLISGGGKFFPEPSKLSSSLSAARPDTAIDSRTG
jgi:hypothetical protein